MIKIRGKCHSNGLSVGNSIREEKEYKTYKGKISNKPKIINPGLKGKRKNLSQTRNVFLFCLVCR